tara:strand:+ start:1245 stop:1463 length:219 start_codon:yes stop_codon:yes gene_type:complete
MRILKLIISSLLLTLWGVATFLIGGAAIVTVFPAIIICCCPEIFLLWCLPAAFLLVFGGWCSEEQMKTMFRQ